ncbi:MAG: hypothetical protein WCT03_16455 [Candidatus Obscuribacterales bacterium]|jgi:hypothetical protein
MNEHEHNNAQPLRELEWLSQYFREHAREDLAKDIFDQVKGLRHLAQDSLKQQAEVIDIDTLRNKKSEGAE